MALERQDCAVATLGDLLYRDAQSRRASEYDWVALVRAIGVGDRQALRLLYERTWQVVFTLIMRIVEEREAAEELTLDVFHEVWRQAGSYEASGGTVVGWIMNQARFVALERVRLRQGVHAAGAAAAPVGSELGPGEVDETLRRAVPGHPPRSVLAALTPSERLAIEAACFRQLSHAELAARLQQPLDTVGALIRSAMEKLGRALATSPETP